MDITKHLFRHKGGGGGGGTPIISAPPAAPATETSIEVVQAKQLARQQAKAKKGINSTILGDALGNSAGQMKQASTAPQGNLMLGG